MGSGRASAQAANQSTAVMGALPLPIERSLPVTRSAMIMAAPLSFRLLPQDRHEAAGGHPVQLADDDRRAPAHIGELLRQLRRRIDRAFDAPEMARDMGAHVFERPISRIGRSDGDGFHDAAMAQAEVRSWRMRLEGGSGARARTPSFGILLAGHHMQPRKVLRCRPPGTGALFGFVAPLLALTSGLGLIVATYPACAELLKRAAMMRTRSGFIDRKAELVGAKPLSKSAPRAPITPSSQPRSIATGRS